jgi:hypothetical protein
MNKSFPKVTPMKLDEEPEPSDKRSAFLAFKNSVNTGAMTSEATVCV